ncbi:hypothetical protein [Lysinibacter sp. HNR]|uniref:hypothetical protein n=1 Tax=Lysinibacter sp. HNR TaxID=3031408 RepID=UPI0024351C7C|nr:hypothetical protein [Lysinibacter sp. HNR]WGD38460.1 hypothetical protein FrondiHNR_06005 [Lysinibacter sp. HNR]
MTTHNFDLDAWLGDTEATPEQRAALIEALDGIEKRYPHADLEDSRTDASRGALEIILDSENPEQTLEDLGLEWQRAKLKERERMAVLTGAIIAASAHMTEVDIARVAQVNRTTVRAALRKDK